MSFHVRIQTTTYSSDKSLPLLINRYTSSHESMPTMICTVSSFALTNNLKIKIKSFSYMQMAELSLP